MKITVEKRTSQKSGKTYVCLCADLGYTTKPITFDMLTICEVANLSVRDIANMRVGDVINVD